jgi:hypothetical protein
MTRSRRGNAMYALVYDYAMVQITGAYWATYSQNPRISWPLMRRGLQDHYDRFPSTFNLERFALHACIARDLPLLQNLVGMLDARPAAKTNAGWTPESAQRCRVLLPKKRERGPAYRIAPGN